MTNIECKNVSRITPTHIPILYKNTAAFLYKENVSFTIHDDDILTNFGGGTVRLRLDKLTS